MPPHRRKTARSAIRTVRVRFQAAFRRPADTRFLLLSNNFHKTARKHLIFPVLSYIMVRHSRDTRSRVSYAATVPRPICPPSERYISRMGGKNSISCHVAVAPCGVRRFAARLRRSRQSTSSVRKNQVKNTLVKILIQCPLKGFC